MFLSNESPLDGRVGPAPLIDWSENSPPPRLRSVCDDALLAGLRKPSSRRGQGKDGRAPAAALVRAAPCSAPPPSLAPPSGVMQLHSSSGIVRAKHSGNVARHVSRCTKP